MEDRTPQLLARTLPTREAPTGLNLALTVDDVRGASPLELPSPGPRSAANDFATSNVATVRSITPPTLVSAAPLARVEQQPSAAMATTIYAAPVSMPLPPRPRSRLPRATVAASSVVLLVGALAIGIFVGTRVGELRATTGASSSSTPTTSAPMTTTPKVDHPPATLPPPVTAAPTLAPPQLAPAPTPTPTTKPPKAAPSAAKRKPLDLGF